MLQQKKTFFEEFSIAFAKPYLWEKCRELTRILPMATQNELHLVFGKICGDIFGYGAGGVGFGWDIASLTRTSGGSTYSGLSQNYRDFHAALSFLGTNGPMFTAIYRLMREPSFIYEFPVTMLPPSCQKGMNLSSGSGHGLSAFEYYLYHFAGLLVRRQKLNLAPTNVNVNATSDTLYPLLVEDYLATFLPIDPVLQSNLYAQAFRQSLPSPASSQQQQQQQQQQTSPMKSNSYSRPSLFRKDFSPNLLKREEPRQEFIKDSGKSSPSSNETWRSDTLVRAFVMFWIEGYVGDDSLNDSLSPGALSASSIDYVSASIRVASTLPSAELVRVVRMFIKHSHYFANACRQGSAFLPESMKIDVFGSRINQSCLLAFLARSIDRWPYDASFRLVLETWLSYIQPWRYLSINNSTSDEETKMDPIRFGQFVSDNYAFFSKLLAKVLRRFQRLDVSSSKNAFMLFRVFKVIGQDNLMACIKSASVSQAYANSAKSSENIFGPEFKEKMAELLVSALRSIEYEKKRFKADSAAGDKSAKKDAESILASLVKFIFSDNSSTNSDPEKNESEKVVQHLTFVADKISSLFELEHVRSEFKSGMSASNDPAADQTDLAAAYQDSGLSPAQKRGLLYRKLKHDGKYRGHPDMLPIRSDEVAGLVRCLHKLSSWINDKWADVIEDTYHRTDLVGGIARELLAPPTCYLARIDQIDSNLNNSRMMANSSFHGLPKQVVKLPPRLFLRPLGSLMAVSYFFIYLASAMLLFGRSSFGAVIWLILFASMFVFFKSIFSPCPKYGKKHEENTENILNQSLLLSEESIS